MPSVAKSILVVDDDADMLKIARQALTVFLNADVTTSSDAEYAFELAMKMQFDLFLFDFSMPKMRGDILYNLICAAYANACVPARSFTPLLLMSGHGNHAQARELLRQPMVRGLIPKPFGVEELIDKVSACFPSEFPSLNEA